MRFYRYCFLIYFYCMLEFVTLDDSDILKIVRGSCRFELHTSRVTWEKAYQVCKHRGLTLASLTASAEGEEMASFVDKANSAFSQYISSSISRYFHPIILELLVIVSWGYGFWIGLRMESTPGGTSAFHWGDCITNQAVTNSFESLTSYSEATACGCFSDDSVKLTRCHSTVSMGFMCENPNGMDSCFSTISTTIHALGYSTKTALTSSNCASSCLTSSSCGAIYVSSGDSCTLMSYSSNMASTLSVSQLVSTYYYHKRLVYIGPYMSAFNLGLSADELCNLPIGSPIVTTALADVTTTEFIAPTTTKEVTTQPIPEETTTDETLDETTTDDITTQTTPEGTTTDDVTAQISNGVSTTITQITTYNFSSCSCVCVEKNETLEEKIEKIVTELKVDTSSLSSTMRQKTCAEDPRPSAKSVGMLGVAIFAVIMGLIISVDIIRFLQYLDRKIKRIVMRTS